MSHSPLRPEQLQALNQKVHWLRNLHTELNELGLCMVSEPGHEEHLLLNIVEMRGKVQELDLELFRAIQLVNKMWIDNRPVSVDAFTPKPKPAMTLEDL